MNFSTTFEPIDRLLTGGAGASRSSFRNATSAESVWNRPGEQRTFRCWSAEPTDKHQPLSIKSKAFMGVGPGLPATGFATV